MEMDVGEIGWGDMDLLGPVQDRDRWRTPVNKIMNLRFP
jgi:hypothetical protein